MDETNREVVPEATLRHLAERIFESTGCDPEMARLTADVLIEAELRGHSTHGMLRVPNPLAIAVPTQDDPILLDFATSAVAMGTVLEAQITGDPIPEGAAIGPDGRPTTDANAVRQGALSPFGGHKEYGLCLMIGLIAGPLIGAKIGKPLGEAVRNGFYDKGELIIAIDPEAFGDPTIFHTAVAAHLGELKEVTPIPGSSPVRMPGERSFAERKRRLRDGIPVDSQVWSQLLALAES